MESQSSLFGQDLIYWLGGVTALSAAAVYVLRNKPKKFWKFVDLVWVATFVGSVIVVLLTFREQELQLQYDRAVREIAQDNRTIVNNINQIDCLTYEARQRDKTTEWRAVCQILQKLSDGIQIKGLTYDGVIDQWRDNPQRDHYLTERYSGRGGRRENWVDGATTLSELGQAVNNLTGVSLFGESVEPSALEDRGISIEFSSIAEEEEAFIFTQDGLVLPLTTQERRVVLLVIDVSYWRNRQEALLSRLPAAPSKRSTKTQPFVLIFACMVFPFRIGKSIYELKEASKNPQPSG